MIRWDSRHVKWKFTRIIMDYQHWLIGDPTWRYRRDRVKKKHQTCYRSETLMVEYFSSYGTYLKSDSSTHFLLRIDTAVKVSSEGYVGADGGDTRCCVQSIVMIWPHRIKNIIIHVEYLSMSLRRRYSYNGLMEPISNPRAEKIKHGFV